MVLSLYLSRGSSDVDEIRCPGAHFGSKNEHVTKNKIFEIHMADVRHNENPFLGYISVVYCPIDAKVGM